MSLEDLKKEHSSRPRNPLLANACFLGGYIDAWGRGTLKIINACRDAGLPDPEMIEKNGGVSMTIFAHPISSEVGENSTTKMQKKALGEKLGENDSAVIDLLSKNKKATIVSIAKEIGLSTTGVEKIIARLKDRNLIKRIGSAKGGHWEVTVE